MLWSEARRLRMSRLDERAGAVLPLMVSEGDDCGALGWVAHEDGPPCVRAARNVRLCAALVPVH